MTIDHVLLSDTFGQWVVTTNEIIDLLNANFDLASLDTTDKSSLIAAINELHNGKYDKTGGTITGNVLITQDLTVEGDGFFGKDGGGDTCLHFFDDVGNVYRSLCWDASAQKWIIEDASSVNQNLFHSGQTINLGLLGSVLNTDTVIQFKVGSTAENDAYTGLLGELTVDTDENQLRLHDGVTAGGTPIGGFSNDDFDISSFPDGTGLMADEDNILFEDLTDGGEKFGPITDLIAVIQNSSNFGLKGVQAFTASGIYNATAGTKSVLVFVTGGGGAPTGSGGSSSFGGFCSATGGGIGGGLTAGNTTVGGEGGVGIGGIINIVGGDASVGSIDSGTGGDTPSIGGSSFWGGGNSIGSANSYGSGTRGGGSDGGGGAGGTSIDFITSGFDGTVVTIGTGGALAADGIVVVFEFG